MAKQAIQVPTGIGPAFSSEIWNAGLGGLAISWSAKGSNDTVWYLEDDNPPEPNGLSPAQVTTLQNVIAAHNPLALAPPGEEDMMRNYVVDYANTLKLMSDAQRKQQTSTSEFEMFLDYLIELGPEGL